MKTGDIKAIVWNELEYFLSPEDITKSHIKSEHFGVGICLVNCLTCGGHEPGVFGGRTLPESAVRFVPDLPEFYLSCKMFYGLPDEIAICFNSFGRSRVVKIRSVRQVAEEQESVLMTQVDQPVVIVKLVLAFIFLDSSPGEVLPST